VLNYRTVQDWLRWLREKKIVEYHGPGNYTVVPAPSPFQELAPDLMPDAPEADFAAARAYPIDDILDVSKRGRFVGARRPNTIAWSSDDMRRFSRTLAAKIQKAHRTVCYFEIRADQGLGELFKLLEKALVQVANSEDAVLPLSVGDHLAQKAIAFAPAIGPLLGMNPTSIVMLVGVEGITDADELEALRSMVWSWTETSFVLIGRHLPTNVNQTEDCDLRGDALVTFGPAREKIAKAIHDFYLAGATSPTWEELEENQRISNYYQADYIPAQLSALGLFIKPFEAGDDEEFVFEQYQVEFLATREHERWLGEKKLQGYRLAEPGEARNDNPDDGDLRHPALKPWSRLEDVYRDNCRRAVRSIPSILDRVGLSIGVSPSISLV
jgi:hypothetical protein